MTQNPTVEVADCMMQQHWGMSKGKGYDCSMDDKCAPAAGSDMTAAATPGGRTVQCVKFQKELPGLDAPPWPGELGRRIYDNVSAQAWKLWEERMKMILNEYRLMPWQKEAQELIAKHMEDFFFGEDAALPPGYVPQQAKG
jgi:Fe-S cluster biosynthesis and repair protein YggX